MSFNRFFSILKIFTLILVSHLALQATAWDSLNSRLWFEDETRHSGPEAVHVLKIKYDVQCSDSYRFPYYRIADGRVTITETSIKGVRNQRTIRLDLAEGSREINLVLGTGTSNLQRQVKVETAATGMFCEVKSLQSSIQTIDANPMKPHLSLEEKNRRMALLYAPFIVHREDQVNQNRFSDILLDVYWEAKKFDDEIQITYYGIFSDEDSKTKSSEIASQYARYGRSLDIEWIYRFKYNPQSRFLRAYDMEYQGFLHFSRDFDGKTAEGHNRFPVLYNNADNNVFTDSDDRELSGYHFAPLFENKKSNPVNARETLALLNPWMYCVSQNECRIEKKHFKDVTDYLFILINGKNPGDKIKAKVTIHNLLKSKTESFLSGGGQGNIDRLGEDSWEQQAMTAVPIGFINLARIERNESVEEKIEFLDDNTIQSNDFEIKSLRFFYLDQNYPKENGTLTLKELTPKFQCNLTGKLQNAIDTECVLVTPNLK